MNGPEGMPHLNMVHIGFAVATLDATKATTELLFELLDELDDIDREALLSLTESALGVDAREFPTQEQEHEYRYTTFRKYFEDLEMMDHLKVHAVVLDVLNRYRLWSDPAELDRRAKMLEGFAEFIEGKEDCDTGKYRIMAEESRVQKKSDLQVARRRYDLICEKVARPILERALGG